MKIFDFIVLVLLFTLLFFGIYFLWLNLPQETVEFEDYVGNLSLNLPENSTQFYPNMRYSARSISYSLAANCSSKKKIDFKRATEIIQAKTVLSFYESNQPGIIVSCTNVAPDPQEEGHFIAGEGGPTTIINTSMYSVITLGKVALYRPESCETPQIAIHEIFHVLGFDHNNNTKSIMYPYTNCKQKIDKYLIDEINNLYRQVPNADLIIESIVANKSGRFLNFEATVTNQGLKIVEDSDLNLYVGNNLVKSFPLGELDVGSKRTLTVENLKIPRNSIEIIFQAQTTEIEISKENNIAKIRIEI